jgi:uncharacterized membrane protein
MLYVFFEWIAQAVDITGAFIMIWGFLMAVYGFIHALLRKGEAERFRCLQKVRCNLGIKLVFALELMIISDLLQSIVSRSMEDLLMVGALVVIRTVISFFLNKEIEEIHATISE